MTRFYHIRSDCRLCRSPQLERVLPLSPIPIATPNFRLAGVSKDDRSYREAAPLALDQCGDCGMLQVSTVGDAHTQFENYVYTTSLSLGLMAHFKRYADEVSASIDPKAGALVVEIGSNDGTLLRNFQNRGLRVQGCDPAAAIAAHATAQGIPTLAQFFGADAARQIRGALGPAAIVLANNVIANIDDLDDLTNGVRLLLAEDGVFIFETQYGLDVIRHNLLDTVYHEHLSYFNVRPLTLYFRRHGMEVVDVLPINTKGGSIRVTVQKIGGPRPVAATVAKFLSLEDSEGAYGPEIYTRMAGRIATIRDDLHQTIAVARATGRPIGGFGVSVGTTTLLAQFGLEEQIDMLFDDDTGKEPILSGPGYDLPVFESAAVMKCDPAVIIMFAWRYVDAILAKQRHWLEQGGRAVVPLPDMRIVDRLSDRSV